MQLSATTLNFTVAPGTSSSQNITITNTGGNTLTWSVTNNTAPTWLAVSPTSGSNAAGASAPLTFTVTVPLLTPPGTYSATVTITPSNGSPQTVTVNLMVS
jgi:uncharacterized membrane protein